MYKGIIFDLDGTLLDTIEDIGNSVNLMLEDYHYPTHAIKDYKLKVGHGFKDLILKSLPANYDIDFDEAYNKFVEYYDHNYLNHSNPYEGIVEALTKLNDLGIKIAINSNKRDDYTKKLANTKLSTIEFVHVLGQVDDLPKKPAPDGANLILNMMNLTKDEVIYVGDSATDIKTAQNAGLKSVGVAWGFRGYDELNEANADFIINHPYELLNLISE